MLRSQTVFMRMLPVADRVLAAVVANPPLLLMLFVVASAEGGTVDTADPRLAAMRGFLVGGGVFSAAEFDGWFSPEPTAPAI